MPYKDLLVMIDLSSHCRVRLEAAAGLARRLGAHLAGLYVMPALDVSPFVADQFSSETLDDVHAGAAQRRDEVLALFRAVTEAAGIAGEWLEERGDPTEFAIAHARLADLVILGQVDPEESSREIGAVAVERLLVETGRPALVIPYSGNFARFGERIVVAWNGSAQAARAVHDALPLLAAAERVVVLTISAPNAAPGPEELIAQRIGGHLTRHGVTAELRRTVDADISAGDALLSFAADEGADLIVMGAYGHSRLRELILGGVSLDTLKHMTMPTLMAH